MKANANVGVTVAAAVMLLAGCAGSDSGKEVADSSGSSTVSGASTSSSSDDAATSKVDCADPGLSQAEWSQHCGPDATGGGRVRWSV